MIDNQPTSDDRTLAVVTQISGIFLSFIVPLIVWLTQKDTKPWLAEESKEALNFQITVFIAYVVCAFLIFVVLGAFLIWILWVANIVFCILAAIRNSQGQKYRYPLTLRLIK